MIKIIFIIIVIAAILYGLFSWFCFFRDIFYKIKSKKQQKHEHSEE